MDSSGTAAPIPFGPNLYADLRGSCVLGEFGGIGKLELSSFDRGQSKHLGLGVLRTPPLGAQAPGQPTSDEYVSSPMQFAFPLRFCTVASVLTLAQPGPRSTLTPGGRPSLYGGPSVC